MAGQHVHKLRQLVEARFTQEMAKRGDPGIGPQLLVHGPFGARRRIGFQMASKSLLRIAYHRAQFQAGKRLATLSDSAMREDGHAAVLKIYADAEYQHNGKQYCYRKRRNGYINHSRHVRIECVYHRTLLDSNVGYTCIFIDRHTRSKEAIIRHGPPFRILSLTLQCNISILRCTAQPFVTQLNPF